MTTLSGIGVVKGIQSKEVNGKSFYAVQITDKYINSTSKWIGLLIPTNVFDALCPDGLKEFDVVSYKCEPQFSPYLCKNGEYGVSVSSFNVMRLHKED